VNTPAHAIINLVLFRREARNRHALAIITGALVPDAPMFAFYLWSRSAGLSERSIWHNGYFDPGWQTLFDIFHSFPLITLAWLVAWKLRIRAVTAFVGSMFLHSCFDFPLHHNDAHRHFFPFSDWQFHSPVSYWNPAWHGQIIGGIEFVAVLAGAAWLLREEEGRTLRRGVLCVLLLYLAYWGVVSLMWM